ncbi:prolipoprotein diacylglyceryl transferase [bacterium]|nr:MAG: prolipoprotein diacylglyceryl transferase [bacterium]
MSILQSRRYEILAVVAIVVAVGAMAKFIFSGDVILPQFFDIAGLRIYSYGIILAAAILAGYYLARRRAQKFGLTLDQLDSISLILIVAGFIGARLYHIVTDFSYYQASWQSVVYVWNGGLGIYGAIIGGLLGLWWYKRSRLPEYSFLKLLDYLAPSVLAGQIVGRLGNLFNYELFGVPTNLPWKMFVPAAFRIPPYETSQFFHPLFLYEALAGLLILYILIKWVNPKPGQIFWFWLGSYSIVRLFVEMIRAENTYLFGIPQYALVSTPLILISLVMLVKSRHEPQKS